MGRHTVPGTGTPEPDRGFWVRAAVAAVAVVLVGGYLLTRGGGDDQVGTAAPQASRSATATSTATPTSSVAAPTTSATASPTGSGAVAATSSTGAPTRPPTLAFTVRYPAYITVRVPGGRTLVSKVFKTGAKATYDQKVLEVVNGRPRAVRFVVNGKPRKQGPTGQTETFTVRRR